MFMVHRRNRNGPGNRQHEAVTRQVEVWELHLSQVFGSLVGNALKYRSKQTPDIETRAVRNGEYWLISVEDNGIGIAPEYPDQIFGPFKRLHTAEQYPDTGIGLALCQKIVERYGGASRWIPSPASPLFGLWR